MSSPLRLSIAKPSPATAARIAAVGRQTFQEAFGQDNRPEDITAFVDEVYAPENVLRELHDPTLTFFLAEMQGELVGFAKVGRNSALGLAPGEDAAGRLELRQLYVLEDWIGTGLGKALMRRCLDLAQAEKCSCVVLGVWERNERAIQFYQRFGFRQIGQHAFRVGEDVQTDLILRKGLAGR